MRGTKRTLTKRYFGGNQLEAIIYILGDEMVASYCMLLVSVANALLNRLWFIWEMHILS